jgi:hypothetical protein
MSLYLDPWFFYVAPLRRKWRQWFCKEIPRRKVAMRRGAFTSKLNLGRVTGTPKGRHGKHGVKTWGKRENHGKPMGNIGVYDT